MIRNLLLDPKPCGTRGLWTLDNGHNKGTPANMAFTQDGLTLTGHETTGSAYTVLTVRNVPEGRNTLSFCLRSDNPDVTFNANGGTNNVAKINRGNWSGIYDIRPAGVNRTYAAAFNMAIAEDETAITALNQAQEQFYRQFMPEERNNNER